MKLPRFMPILASFTARVANCEMTDLWQSPTALAQALADTQVVVGHDGVLNFFDPTLMFRACTGRSVGATGGPGDGVLTASDEIVGAAPVATMLEAMEPLRFRLPDSAMIYSVIAGPGLLWSQFQDDAGTANRDPDANAAFVVSVVRNVVRSSLDMKADGVALIERISPADPPKLLRTHKAVRKLADFYDAGFVVFRLPGCDPNLPATAHCVFDLAGQKGRAAPVIGLSGAMEGAGHRCLTTTGDVPADTPVDELTALVELAAGR